MYPFTSPSSTVRNRWYIAAFANEISRDPIPPYEDFGLDQPGWRYSSPHDFRLNGRAQLLVDNLMDLTHLPYIHHHIGGGQAMRNPHITEEQCDRFGRCII